MYRFLWLTPAALIIAAIVYLGFFGLSVNVETVKKEIPITQFLG